MKKLKEEYLEVIEEYGWRVCSYGDDGRVELETWSPAGENLIICVDVENFPYAVWEYYQDFDIDEHIEMRVEARKNGVEGVPSIRELCHDAEEIDKMLKRLAGRLAEVDAWNCILH